MAGNDAMDVALQAFPLATCVTLRLNTLYTIVCVAECSPHGHTMITEHRDAHNVPSFN